MFQIHGAGCASLSGLQIIQNPPKLIVIHGRKMAAKRDFFGIALCCNFNFAHGSPH
jgi:hypothetical protein